MRKVEILAPAGSYESMTAAIMAGCDAVYIGGRQFGARAFAENLSEEDLKRAIDFVHLREKKLYLTVNTLLKEEELQEELYDYLLPFYEQGLDAVIVQDIGVMSFLHREFPLLPIHASTQLSLTQSIGAEGLKTFGVTRFVPARELSLEELKEIRKETDLEIETFVHGALCYSYSGKCLLSSMIGGRSGNRGRCAQPCRMSYRTEDGKEGCFMSPKDICTLELLPDLIDAGMDSFKIEGRMKRPAYAAFTSFLYGKYADLYGTLGREEYEQYTRRHKREFEEDKRALLDLYNRGGFSQGYYTRYHGKSMMSVQRPNHSGVLVGRVSKAEKRQACIRLLEDVSGQDILEFRNKKELPAYEYTLKTGAAAGEEIKANILPGSKIFAGMPVYRTRNQILLSKISRDFLEKEPSVRISGSFMAKPGEPVKITFSCERASGESISVSVFGEKAQIAKNQPITEEKIKKSMSSMQGSGFCLEELQVKRSDNVFIPAGWLKELRRKGLEGLFAALTAPYRRTCPEKRGFPEKAEKNPASVSRKRLPEIDASVLTVEQAGAVLEQGIGRIYLTQELYFKCCETGLDFSGKEVVFTLPYVLRKNTMEQLPGEGAAFLIRNHEELFWLLEKYRKSPGEKRPRLVLDMGMYVLNKEAEEAYLKLGADETTASPELTYEELLKAGCEEKTILVYGHLPLMVTAQCMADTVYSCHKKEGFLTFYDRKGKQFLLRTACRECCNIIYDGIPLCLLEEKEAVESLLPKRLRLDFTVEQKEETGQILKAFFEVYRYNKEKEALEKKTTKGHFRKGVL